MANDSAGNTYDLGSIPGLHSFHLFFPIKRLGTGSVKWTTLHLQNQAFHASKGTRSMAQIQGV